MRPLANNIGDPMFTAILPNIIGNRLATQFLMDQAVVTAPRGPRIGYNALPSVWHTHFGKRLVGGWGSAAVMAAGHRNPAKRFLETAVGPVVATNLLHDISAKYLEQQAAALDMDCRGRSWMQTRTFIENLPLNNDLGNEESVIYSRARQQAHRHHHNRHHSPQHRRQR